MGANHLAEGPIQEVADGGMLTELRSTIWQQLPPLATQCGGHEQLPQLKTAAPTLSARRRTTTFSHQAVTSALKKTRVPLIFLYCAVFFSCCNYANVALIKAFLKFTSNLSFFDKNSFITFMHHSWQSIGFHYPLLKSLSRRVYLPAVSHVQGNCIRTSVWIILPTACCSNWKQKWANKFKSSVIKLAGGGLEEGSVCVCVRVGWGVLPADEEREKVRSKLFESLQNESKHPPSSEP